MLLYAFGLESKRYPAASQRAALTAFGVPARRVIIEDRQADEEFNYLVTRSLRDGEDAGVVVQRFHLLAPGASELRRHIKAIHAKKVVIVESETKRRSDNSDDLVDMICEAHAVYTGRLLDPKVASKIGKKGAKARKVNDIERRPKIEAQIDWRNPEHRNWQEALAAVNSDLQYRGYSKNAAYKILGKRFVFPGRRPNSMSI